METNLTVVLICGVLAMFVGAMWYSPLLFGSIWMRLNNMKAPSPKEMAKMQKEMIPTYLLQFALVLGQVYVLSYFIKSFSSVSGVEIAVWLWLGFIVPTLAASVMWTNENTRDKVSRFAVQAGYNLILFVTFGYILGMWG